MTRGLALTVLLLLPACRHPAPTTTTSKPHTCYGDEREVRFERIDRLLPTDDGATLSTAWEVNNPTDDDLVIETWAGTLKYGDLSVAITHPGLALAPHSCAPVELDFPVQYAAAFPADAPHWVTEHYVVTVSAKTGGGPLSATRQGDVSATGSPNFHIRDVAITPHDLQATLELTVDALNGNVFPLMLEHFDADFFIAGAKVTHLHSDERRLLARQAHSTFKFGFELSPQAFNGLVQAALKSTEPMSTDLKGTAACTGADFRVSAGGMSRVTQRR